MDQEKGVPIISPVAPRQVAGDQAAPTASNSRHCARIQEWIAYAERNGIRAVEQKEDGHTGTITILVFRHTIQGCKVELLTKENLEPYLYASKKEAQAKIQQLVAAPYCTQYGEIRAPQYLAVTL